MDTWDQCGSNAEVAMTPGPSLSHGLFWLADVVPADAATAVKDLPVGVLQKGPFVHHQLKSHKTREKSPRARSSGKT